MMNILKFMCSACLIVNVMPQDIVELPADVSANTVYATSDLPKLNQSKGTNSTFPSAENVSANSVTVNPLNDSDISMNSSSVINYTQTVIPSNSTASTNITTSTTFYFNASVTTSSSNQEANISESSDTTDTMTVLSTSELPTESPVPDESESDNEDEEIGMRPAMFLQDYCSCDMKVWTRREINFALKSCCNFTRKQRAKKGRLQVIDELT
jgi:hypothetical protein